MGVRCNQGAQDRIWPYSIAASYINDIGFWVLADLRYTQNGDLFSIGAQISSGHDGFPNDAAFFHDNSVRDIKRLTPPPARTLLSNTSPVLFSLDRATRQLPQRLRRIRVADSNVANGVEQIN